MNEPRTDLRRPALAALLGFLVVAVIVRVLYWMQAGDLSLVQEPTGDALTHLEFARELARYGLLAPAGEAYRQAPLYPFFLRLLDALGLDPGGVRAVQFALGTAGVALLWSVGRRVAGTPGAVVGAAGAALYGPFVFFEGELLSISLAVFLLEVALVLWGRRRAALFAGFSLGLSALAQPNLLAAGLAVAGASILFPRALGWSSRRAAVLLCAGLLVAPAASGIRNLAVSGQPVLISLNGGVNFFIGNNADADGTFHLPPDSGLVNRPEGLFTSAREVAEERAGRPLSAVQVDRAWWLRGVDFWISRPGPALGLFSRKVLLALNNYEFPNHYDYDYFRSRIAVLAVLPTLAWLLPFGGVGLLLGWRRGWRWGPVLFAAILISVSLFFVTARYRLPLAVLLWPAAGLAVERALALRRNRRWLAVAGGAAAVYLVLALIPFNAGGVARSHMLNLEGATLFRQGDLPGAERAFRESVALRPGNAEALSNLGRALMLQGKGQEALAYFRQALVADSTQAETYFNLEEMYRAAGRREEALALLDRLERARQGRLGEAGAEVAYRRAVNLFALGDTATAVNELSEAVRLDPSRGGAWLTLSVVLRKLGDPKASLEAAQRGVSMSEDTQQAALVYAAALEANGDWMGAAGAYQHALQIGPADNQVRYQLGRALVRAGRDADAEPYLVQANEGRPHPEALLELGALYERTGRIAEARTAYRALLQLGSPYREQARARLDALGPSSGDERR